MKETWIKERHNERQKEGERETQEKQRGREDKLNLTATRQKTGICMKKRRKKRTTAVCCFSFSSSPLQFLSPPFPFLFLFFSVLRRCGVIFTVVFERQFLGVKHSSAVYASLVMMLGKTGRDDVKQRRGARERREWERERGEEKKTKKEIFSQFVGGKHSSAVYASLVMMSDKIGIEDVKRRIGEREEEERTSKRYSFTNSFWTYKENGKEKGRS